VGGNVSRRGGRGQILHRDITGRGPSLRRGRPGADVRVTTHTHQADGAVNPGVDRANASEAMERLAGGGRAWAIGSVGFGLGLRSCSSSASAPTRSRASSAGSRRVGRGAAVRLGDRDGSVVCWGSAYRRPVVSGGASRPIRGALTVPPGFRQVTWNRSRPAAALQTLFPGLPDAAGFRRLRSAPVQPATKHPAVWPAAVRIRSGDPTRDVRAKRHGSQRAPGSQT